MTAKKTLVIVDHPTYDRSNANRRLVEEMRKYPDDILIHNLQSAYPTGTIDVAKEHCLVDNSDAIIFQFPLYWFTCPPKTKEWFDKVLTAGWAFAGTYHLEGKKIGIAVTCGSEETDYTAQGVHHLQLKSTWSQCGNLLKCVKLTISVCLQFMELRTTIKKQLRELL